MLLMSKVLCTLLMLAEARPSAMSSKDALIGAGFCFHSFVAAYAAAACAALWVSSLWLVRVW